MERNVFLNQGYATLMRQVTLAVRLTCRVNRRPPALQTVSPVPLTATAWEHNVQMATSHSNSLLWAVASELVRSQSRLDCPPSYQIITQPAYKSRFIAANLRSVLPGGQDHVVTQFIRVQTEHFGGETAAAPETLPEPARPFLYEEPEPAEAEELRYEEQLPAAFESAGRHD